MKTTLSLWAIQKQVTDCSLPTLASNHPFILRACHQSHRPTYRIGENSLSSPSFSWPPSPSVPQVQKPLPISLDDSLSLDASDDLTKVFHIKEWLAGISLPSGNFHLKEHAHTCVVNWMLKKTCLSNRIPRSSFRELILELWGFPGKLSCLLGTYYLVGEAGQRHLKI